MRKPLSSSPLIQMSLQQWLQRWGPSPRANGGFTLIELLVVIIIIGILAAIALPSLLAQVAKSRQAEAKSIVGAMNRSQQAYYLEKQTFTAALSALGLGISSNTANYQYLLSVLPGGEATTHRGWSTKSIHRSYAGVAYIDPLSTESKVDTAMCTAENFNYYVGNLPIPDGTFVAPNCPAGFLQE
ncbi:MAG: prepilin-type N-terminal cleavage/methylation domain-containing protein [Oscillatoriales cyanobacterium SM2_1_8]|nr:prepilin-type N-terminal cleavage/methylation domain-containing protein [Oscillatoriales cyanobacterium SM2_1_8]